MSEEIRTKDPKAMAQKCIEWLESDEGRAAMREASKRSDEFAKQLREMSKVPWEKLHEPFTI